MVLTVLLRWLLFIWRELVCWCVYVWGFGLLHVVLLVLARVLWVGWFIV